MVNKLIILTKRIKNFIVSAFLSSVCELFCETISTIQHAAFLYFDVKKTIKKILPIPALDYLIIIVFRKHAPKNLKQKNFKSFDAVETRL